MIEREEGRQVTKRLESGGPQLSWAPAPPFGGSSRSERALSRRWTTRSKIARLEVLLPWLNLG